ncbi:MAG: trypsin-like peptidase domain-containing protein [Nitrosomonadales bacterium]|nr:trypsin-like peptidase domain-containing protein [Nitrosomonadales bacterium]
MAENPEYWPVSGVNLSVSIIQCYVGATMVASASGFFFRHNHKKYLATNRHVVIDDEEHYFPDRLAIRLHRSITNPELNVVVPVSLYDDHHQRLWLEHPAQELLKCDVVLVPLPEVAIAGAHINFMAVENFPDSRLNVPPFSDVVVVGYPLGFHDEVNNLPIYRQGMIASPYPSMFERKPYFLIDARLHSGSSGSAVLNSPHNILTRNKAGFHSDQALLLGIFSADFSSNEDPLGLNIVWYSHLLVEIAEGRARAPRRMG